MCGTENRMAEWQTPSSGGDPQCLKLSESTVPLAVESWDDPCSPSPQRPLFHSYGTVSRTLTLPYQTIWVERTSFWPWFLQSRDWFQEVKTYSDPRVLTFESRGVCNTVTFRLKTRHLGLYNMWDHCVSLFYPVIFTPTWITIHQISLSIIFLKRLPCATNLFHFCTQHVFRALWRVLELPKESRVSSKKLFKCGAILFG